VPVPLRSEWSALAPSCCLGTVGKMDSGFWDAVASGPGPHPVGSGRRPLGTRGLSGIFGAVGVGVLLGVRVAGVGGWAKVVRVAHSLHHMCLTWRWRQARWTTS
jgi:hypothetical protein